MEEEENIATTTRRKKPYKLIAYIQLLIGLILFIVIHTSTYWVDSGFGGFRQGLWKECYKGSRVITTPIPITQETVTPVLPSDDEVSCHKAGNEKWLSKCQDLSVLSLFSMIGGAVCVTFSWTTARLLQRRLTLVGGALVVASSILFFHVLLVFPNGISGADVDKYRSLELSWGFRLGWVVLFFQVSSGLFLFLAPVTKEINSSLREV